MPNQLQRVTSGHSECGKSVGGKSNEHKALNSPVTGQDQMSMVSIQEICWETSTEQIALSSPMTAQDQMSLVSIQKICWGKSKKQIALSSPAAGQGQISTVSILNNFSSSSPLVNSWISVHYHTLYLPFHLYSLVSPSDKVINS